MTRSLFLASVLIVALLIVSAASRSGSDDSPRPSQSEASPERDAGSAQAPATAPARHDGGASAPSPAVGSQPARIVPDASMPGPTGAIGTALWSGTATWFCGAGSRCPRGYGPSDLIAAIDRKDSPFRKGDRVTVTYHCGSGCVRRVTVTIVDTCLCGGARLIDLSAKAFRRLAPLGLGVIPVELEAAGAAPTLPPTDQEGTP